MFSLQVNNELFGLFLFVDGWKNFIVYKNKIIKNSIDRKFNFSENS